MPPAIEPWEEYTHDPTSEREAFDTLKGSLLHEHILPMSPYEHAIAELKPTEKKLMVLLTGARQAISYNDRFGGEPPRRALLINPMPVSFFMTHEKTPNISWTGRDDVEILPILTRDLLRKLFELQDNQIRMIADRLCTEFMEIMDEWGECSAESVTAWEEEDINSQNSGYETLSYAAHATSTRHWSEKKRSIERSICIVLSE